jgi:transcriptional regulator with XRE-family HTH domain
MLDILNKNVILNSHSLLKGYGMTNLARILEEKGIKQSWLVKKTGLSKYIISGIKTGRRIPKKNEMEIIAKALRTPVGALFFDKEVSVNSISSINTSKSPHSASGDEKHGN